MNDDLNSAKRTIEKEIEALKALENSLDTTLTKAIDIMQNTKGRVIITGMGKSGHIAKKIAATLASTGTPSFFLHPAEASHGDLGMVTENDSVVAISNSGESKELSDVLTFCKRYNIPLIAITKNPLSSLGKAGDIILQLPNNGEACPLGLAPTSSTTATLVLGDVLAVALLERKGFSKTDFNARHPGGKLGSVLLKVSDLMHSGDELPLVSIKTSMKDALLVMSSKRLGCVGIINNNHELEGIITDGDLRRHISDDMFSKKVTDIMTVNPKTTTKEIMAAEAIGIMNAKNITNLFVMDGKKPIGVIHMHDCLKAGVA